MSANKYTPGPWVRRSGELTGFRWNVETTGAHPRAVIARLQEGMRGEGAANAHLIAAAPDMLEALENLVTAYLGSSDPILQINAAVAAIKKARGEK